MHVYVGFISDCEVYSNGKRLVPSNMFPFCGKGVSLPFPAELSLPCRFESNIIFKGNFKKLIRGKFPVERRTHFSRELVYIYIEYI